MVLKLSALKAVFGVEGTAESNFLCCHAVFASATGRTASRADASDFHSIVKEERECPDGTVDSSAADLLYLKCRAGRLDN